MPDKETILQKIKKSILSTAPGAQIILYGSFARGDYHAESDMDILILVDNETISRDEEKKITYPLYDIEFETGQIISPFIKSKKEWVVKYPNTPFYKNVIKEGIEL